jgi:hypothetical protein
VTTGTFAKCLQNVHVILTPENNASSRATGLRVLSHKRLDDFMGDVGAVCALLDAPDVAAFKATATLIAARSRCSGRF